MYMMDSNKITPEMVYKFIDGMYKDTYPGFTKEFFVEVLNYDSYRDSEVVIHVLMDNKVYNNTGLPKDRAQNAVRGMEKKLKEIMNYLPFPYKLKIKRYINDDKSRIDKGRFSGMDTIFHYGGINSFDDYVFKTF